MIILEEFIWNEDHYAYHLTHKHNINKIVTEGLIPMCKERSKANEDTKEAIYFFDNLKNMFDWSYYLYNASLQELELLRFNLKGRKWFLHNNGEDFYLQKQIKPNEIDYLSNLQELESELDLNKNLIWTPIKNYNK